MNKKNMLITGGSAGIGLGLAKYFKDKYNVWICASRADRLKKVCEEYGLAGCCAADLTEDGAVDKLFSTITAPIDILINNAGVYFYSPVEKMKREDIIKSIKLNNLAPYELIRHCVPGMKERNWGRIINIGSISGVMGEANASVYSMTKSALIGLTKSLALELALNNITVNIINPGWVDTELINDEALNEDFSKDEIIETIPQRRFVLPSQIASACDYLISEDAKVVTGQSVNICAGLSVGF